MKKNLHIFGIAFIFRVLVFFVAAVIIALQFFGEKLAFADILNAWNRWDVPHYIDIAKLGYKNATEVCETCRKALIEAGGFETVSDKGQHLFLVFFPLFPWLVKILAFIFRDYILSAIILSFVTYSAGCVYLYNLVLEDHSEEVAKKCLVLISVSPFSFFFGGALTESIFLLIGTASLYYCRKHNWWAMLLFGALASMTRAQGLLLVIPAFVELCMEYKPISSVRNNDIKTFNLFVLRCLSLAVMGLGFIIYLIINFRLEGYALAFAVYQKAHWYNTLAPVWTCFLTVLRCCFGGNYDTPTVFAMWLPELITFVVCAAAICVGYKKIRPSLWIYGLGYLLLSYSSSWLISGNRYMTCCVPVFIILAILLEKKDKLFGVIAIVSTMLMTVYMSGYFSGLHIM